MYLEPTIRRNKRRSSPLRVMVLLMLISAGVYVYAMVQQEEIESPFVPTPTPTRSALSYVTEAEELYLQKPSSPINKESLSNPTTCSSSYPSHGS
jgi:hypothetical protein